MGAKTPSRIWTAKEFTRVVIQKKACKKEELCNEIPTEEIDLSAIDKANERAWERFQNLRQRGDVYLGK